MLRSESCDSASVPRLMPSRGLRTNPTNEPGQPELSDAPDGAASCAKAARGFASVLYSQLFQEMQRTIPQQEDEEGEEETGGIDSAQDFLAMYLPTAMSEQGSDPLSKAIESYMKTQYGETKNERD